MLTIKVLHVCICVLIYLTCVETDYHPPAVTLESCFGSRVVVMVTNMSSGGLMYIRTDTYYNMIPTIDGDLQYECTFEDCKIEWDVKFFIIIQRTVLYQSSDDVIKWFVCSSNVGIISPIQILSETMTDDENTTVVVYKPDSVSMTFVSDDSELPGGSDVKLGTLVHLMLSVPNNPGGMFDIFPKSCWVSSINLLEDKCPLDDDIFGSFARTSAGNVNNTFRMFRPTSISGGPQMVIFNCLLEVCMYNCSETSCDTGNANRRKREADESDRPTMLLGAMLRAVSNSDNQRNEIITNTELFCLSSEILVVITVTFSICFCGAVTMLLFSIYQRVIYVHSIKKFKSRHDAKEATKCETVVTSEATSSESENKDDRDDGSDIEPTSDGKKSEHAHMHSVPTVDCVRRNSTYNTFVLQ